MTTKYRRSRTFPSKPTLLATALASLFTVTGFADTVLAEPTPTPVYTSSQALPEVTIPFERFTLNNGLTAIVNEDRKAPVVAVNLWYKVGSKDESMGQRGFAHLFEHLMFQGSENYKGEFFTPFKEAGATDQNGTTSSDRTNYFQTVPTPALDLALWMESDRMGHFMGAINQESLDEQREVVKNEKRQGENRPYGTMWNRMAEQTFPPGHPYSWPTIGYMEDLNAASLEQVKEWFATYYGPSNAVLVLSGDVDLATAKEKVEKYFGDIPAGKPLSKLDTWIAKRTEEIRDTIQDRVPQARLLKVWNVAQTGTVDAEYLSLLTDVLGSGRNSRLYKRLVLEDELATSVGAFLYDRLLAGQVIVYADARPDASLEAIEEAINEEIAELIKDGPAPEELNRVRFSRSASFVRGTERVGGFGGKSDILAMGEVIHNDPAFYEKSFAIMKMATPQDLQEVAKEWLSSGAYTLEITPFPEYAHNATGADRSKLPEAGEQVDVILPKLEHATLDNGLKVILASRPQTPVVQLELLFDAGLSARGTQPGLPGLTMAMLDEGTTSLDNLQLAEELEKLGTGIDVGNSLDSSSITMDSLTVSLEPSLKILADIIEHPAFKETDLKRVRTNLIEMIRQEQSTPNKIVGRLLPELLYGKDHAYSIPWSGSGDQKSLESLTRDDLITFWKTWLRPDNATLIVTGDITMDKLLPMLNKTLAGWTAPTTSLPEKSVAAVEPAKKSTVYLIDFPEAEQSVIVGSQLVMPSNTEETLPFNLMNDIIGGQFTARINMNLREDKGWAYGANSYAKSARGQRPYMVTTSVQADKTGPAMEEILKEYKAFLTSAPATDSELDLVKRNSIRALPGRYETNNALLGSIGALVEYDMPESYLYDYGERIEKLTLPDMHNSAKQYLTPENFTWVVAGDVAQIRPQIEKLGLGEIVVLGKDGEPVK